MTLTIEIGKGRTIGLTNEQMETLRGHAVVINRVIEIGLKNILSDANAGIGKRETYESDQAYGDAAYAASMKKLDAMLKGEYRGAVERGPRVPSDPVAAEALREARVYVGTKTRGWEKDAKEAIDFLTKIAVALDMPHDGTMEKANYFKSLIAAAIAKRAAREDVIAAAKAVVEARKNVKVDPEDLGL